MGGAAAVVVVVVVAVASVVEGLLGIPDFLETGTCNNATFHENFDILKYQGVWFDIASVPNEYQLTKQCVTQNYTWIDEDEVMTSTGKGLTAEGQKIRQSSYAFVEDELTDNPDPAYMTVVADGMPESPYQIVKTDYVNFACVYSCLDYFGFRAEFTWLFSRTPWLDQHYVDECHEALAAFGVDGGKMEMVRQGESCPYKSKLDTIFNYNNQILTKYSGGSLFIPIPTPRMVKEKEVAINTKIIFQESPGGDDTVDNSAGAVSTCYVMLLTLLASCYVTLV